MRRRILVVSVIAAVALLGVLVLAWVFSPRLVAVSPEPGSQQVAIDAPLRLTFTRPLRPEAAAEHLKLTPDLHGTITWEGNTLIFQPDRPWPGGAQVSVQFTAWVRAQGLWGLPLLSEKTWSFQTRQVLLVYLWPAQDLADLYALDPFAGTVTRLTSTQNVLDFSLGLATHSIYYSVSEDAASSAIRRLPIPENNSTLPQPETVAECSQAECRSLRLSPDGSLLAYERTPLSDNAEPSPTQVWLLSLADGKTRQAGDPAHTTLYPAWSARGWLAFYDNERQGYLVQDTAGHELAFLPSQGGGAGMWSSQKNTFLAMDTLVEVTGLLGPRATHHLVLYEFDDHGAIQHSRDLTADMDLDETLPVFSPDGSAVAFTRQYLDNLRWTPGRQLWWMLADGSQKKQLTDAPFYNHYHYTWSPDGQWLAFVRFNQELLKDPPEMWIMDLTGDDPIQLVQGGFAPQWIP